MNTRVNRVLNSTLFSVVVLLVGYASIAGLSGYFSHRDALANAKQAAEIDAATLVRAKKLYRLRQYTDDGIKDIDTIVRLYARDHPGINLPPPLPPEPTYDVDNVAGLTTGPTTEP